MYLQSTENPVCEYPPFSRIGSGNYIKRRIFIYHYEEINSICVVFNFKDNIKESFLLNLLIKSLKLVIGVDVVEEINIKPNQHNQSIDTCKYLWNSDKELIVPFHFNFSNGVIFGKDIKLLEISVYIEILDNYFIEKISGLITYTSPFIEITKNPIKHIKNKGMLELRNEHQKFVQKYLLEEFVKAYMHPNRITKLLEMGYSIDEVL